MSLPILASDPGQIEAAADPVAYVVLACERAKTWLTNALEHGDIDQIVELKSQAEAIRVYTAQKQIGKDAELAAAEVVRRAERGIGVAIRRGQQEGTIRRQGQGRGYTHELPPPSTYASHEELMGNGAGIYHLTDGVTDEQFDTAVSEAKSEGNLARANVVRKVREKVGPQTRLQRKELIAELAAKGMRSSQIAPKAGVTEQTVRQIARDFGFEIPADKVTSRMRRIDPNRVLEESVHTLDGLLLALDLVDIAALDQARVPAWSSSLKSSLRSLNRFSKELDQA